MASKKELSEGVAVLQRRAKEAALNLVVIGRIGQGKSTLVNNLLGFKSNDRGAAKERGVAVTSGTENVIVCSNVRDGATVNVLDTPGLYDSELVNREKTLRQLSEITKGKIDLVLICVACFTGISLKDHASVIRLLTNVYGKDFWKGTVFVLTHVNTIDKDRRAHFQWLASIENGLKKALSEALQSPEYPKEEADRLAESVPCLTAGKEPGKHLPYDNEDWNDRLFLHCLQRINPDTVPTLFQARYGDNVWKFVYSTMGGGVAGAGIGAGIGAVFGLFAGPGGVPAGAAVGAWIGGSAGALFGAGLAYAHQPSQEEMEIIQRELKRYSTKQKTK